MNRYDRRTFLKTTALATGAGLAARFTPSAWAQPSGANEDIRLGVHGVDVNRQNLTLGRWIALDDTADDIVGVEGGDDSHLERARYLLNEAQRPPFAIPQEII